MRRKKKNIVLEKILVEDYAAEGKSLARVDGKVIFIENVVPGDTVDIQLQKNKKDWAEGRAVHFHSYSADRVVPFCQHFGVCGGCQWQMLPYEKQLQFKERQVRDNLKRIGKVELPAIQPILGAKETKYYRNKIEYTFGTREFLPADEFLKRQQAPAKPPPKGEASEQSSVLEKSLLSESSQVSPPAGGGDLEGAAGLGEVGTALGFHAKGMFDKIVDIKTCYLQAEPTNAIRLAIKEFALRNDYSFYNIREHHGLLRTMQVRLCTTGEVMVNIVFGEPDEPRIKKLLDHILHQFPEITTLLYTINTKKNDSLHDLEPVPYFGKGYVIEKLSTIAGEEYQFKIGPKSFFQTNTRQGERLYQVTKDFAELSGNEMVYDLYCGTGSIGIFVSGQAKKIIGVEMIEAAIEDAKENAALNGLGSAEFYAGDVIDICTDDFFAAHGRPDVIITDPPRAGMHEKLVKKILEMAAPVVVYVSCNPATQARDLALLDEKYKVTKIQPVDMFPHTLHIENVVQLKLRAERDKE